MSGPVYQIVTTTIHFGGLGAAAALLLVSTLQLTRQVRPVWGVCCILGSGVSVFLFVRSLLSQQCGVTCTLPTEKDLMLYAGLAAALAVLLFICILFLRGAERA